MTTTDKLKYAKLVPIMLCFFAMGFVDLVGIASNYVKADLNLSDSEANIFPSLVFFLVLDFLCTDRYPDEQNRTEKDSDAQLDCHICVTSYSYFQR